MDESAIINNVGIAKVRQLRSVTCDAHNHLCRSNQPKDWAEITLDIDASKLCALHLPVLSVRHRILTPLVPDLTGVFNWNTHQLFAYVVVEYETKRHVSILEVLGLTKMIHTSSSSPETQSSRSVG